MYLQSCAEDSGKEPIGEDNDRFSPLDLWKSNTTVNKIVRNVH